MLKVRDLSVAFRTEQGMVQAVDDVSFDVGEGETPGRGRRIGLRQDRVAARA